MPRKPPSHLTARNADRHHLYETAVQRPTIIVDFLEELFDVVRPRPPRTLREDFCGTANLAAHWVRSDAERTAVGVDVDGEVLTWGRRHNQQPLGDAAHRLTLIKSDVREVDHPADVVAALNFSSFIYKTRDALHAYLAHAYANVRPGGLMLLDAFGGPESIRPCLDERPFGDFTYQWEQRAFDPLTNRIDCRIHFRFRNGTTWRDAFIYDWRMWSLPELQELLEAVGFNQMGIYFEDEAGFVSELSAEHADAWVAYLVALRD